jgi:hypothetical protein
MCSIFDGNAINQQSVRDEIGGMLAQGYWQTVLGGRPLMFYFQVEGAAMAGDIAAYRELCAELGIPAPYAVAMSGGREMIGEYGADALSNYAIGGSGGMKYAWHIFEAWRQWNRDWFDRVPMVPCWSAGWDARPRYDTPVSWYEPAADSYVADGTPEEIARMLAAALRWCKMNPRRAEANAVIGYAWNEHDEGGWLCPTIRVDGKETGVPLRNADGTYQVDDSRIQALKKAIAEYRGAIR